MTKVETDSVLKPTGLYGTLPEFAITCNAALKVVELTCNPEFIEKRTSFRS